MDMTSEEIKARKAEEVKYEKVKIEKDKVRYKFERHNSYPSVEDQLDMLYWDKKNDTKKWEEAIDKVKTDHPKPE
jgi:hypothetical protein